MSKDKLRPCIVTREQDVEIEQRVNGEQVSTVIRRSKPRKAFFHMWHENKIENYMEILALVEYEDGSMGFVRLNEIVFSDRG